MVNIFIIHLLSNGFRYQVIRHLKISVSKNYPVDTRIPIICNSALNPISEGQSPMSFQAEYFLVALLI